jgi:hypothetical protein
VLYFPADSGITLSIAERSLPRSPMRRASAAVSCVRTARIPQPKSTPAQAGVAFLGDSVPVSFSAVSHLRQTVLTRPIYMCGCGARRTDEGTAIRSQVRCQVPR